MSNVKLSLTAMSAALGLAIAVQSTPVMAQALSADALKGTEFASPDYVEHSWGLEQVSYDAPPVRLSWSDVRQRLEQAKGVAIAAQQGDNRAVPDAVLKGTEFASPDYVRHSWGLEQVSYDAPPVRLNWSEVNQRLDQAAAKVAPAVQQANAQPIPADALRGTEFDTPEYIRHAWGLEYAPFDAPPVRLSWGEIQQRLDQANATPSGKSPA